MERESKYENDQQRFKGGDYLASRTSAQKDYWNEAAGVSLALGAAKRMNGKALIGWADLAVLGFAQIGGLVIVQFADRVAAFGPIFFGVTETITDEDGDPLQTETSATLTT